MLHPSVEQTMAAWVQRDGCEPVAQDGTAIERDGHTARLRTWSHCRDGAEVHHWILAGAGHGWPGGKPAREKLVGPATQVINANTEIWKFVSRFSLAPPKA